MSLRRLYVYEAGGFAVVFLLLTLAFRPAGAAAGDCADLRDQVQVDAVDVSMATLVPRPGETLVFTWNFKHERSTFQDSTRLRWLGAPPAYEGATAPGGGGSASNGGEDVSRIQPGDILALRMRAPRTADSSEQIPASSIGYYAVAIEDGVSIKVCVEADEAAPGVYNSAIEFDDPDISAAPIGVELTVKENDVRWPLGAALAGLFVGIALVTFRWQEAGRPRAGRLGVGLVVGAIGVVPPSYALWSENPTWGGDAFLDMFGLFTATALGIFGSAAVAEALGSNRRPGDTGPPETAPVGGGDGEEGGM